MSDVIGEWKKRKKNLSEDVAAFKRNPSANNFVKLQQSMVRYQEAAQAWRDHFEKVRSGIETARDAGVR